MTRKKVGKITGLSKGIIDYIETVREAIAKEDIGLLLEIQELEDTPVTYKELEEAYSHLVKLLGSLILTQETISKVRFDIITDALLTNGSLSEEEYEELHKQDELLIKELFEEEDEQSDDKE